MVDSKTAANETAPTDEIYAFPTTVGQKRFWALNSLAPGNPALNMPLAARLQGRLDRGKFQQALDAVVRRHEILRSSFQSEADDVVQVVHPGSHRRIEWIERRTLSPESVSAATRELMQAEALKTLDLAQDSQLRAAVASFSEEEHLLMLTMHHIICDGWSNGVLLREIAENYSRLVGGANGQPEELPLQYGDYAVWQKDWLKGAEAAAQLAYWRDHLGEELPVLNLPTDRPRGARPSFNGHIQTLLLPPEIADGLKLLCQREKVTPFMLHLSAYVLLLHRYAGRQEFVVGSPAANRNQTELEGMIGLFANPLLFRFKIDPAMTFRQLLGQVRDLALANFAHQEYPFELIGEELRGQSSHRGVPWLQAYFIFQKAFMQPQEMPGLHLTPLRSTSAGAMFEWMLGVLERSEGVRLQLEYNTDLFELETVERALRHLQAIMAAAIRQPDFIVGELDLNQPKPLGFPETIAPGAPVVASLLGKISAAFGDNPQAQLLVWQDARLSLADLREHALKIGALLASSSVKDALRIAISTDDFLFAIAGAIAICEAGHVAVLQPGSVVSGAFDIILSGPLSAAALKPVTTSGSGAIAEPGLVLQNDFSSRTDKEHRWSVSALCLQAEAVATRLRMRARDTVLITAPIHTLLGWEELLATWLRGATAVAVTDCNRPPALNVSVLMVPTAWWEEMLNRKDSPWPAFCAKARLIAVDRDPVSVAAVKAIVGTKVRVVQRFQPQEIGCTVAIQTVRFPGKNERTLDSHVPVLWIEGWICQLIDHREIVTPRGVPGRLKVESAMHGFLSPVISPDWARERNDGSLEWIGQAGSPDFATEDGLELREITDIAGQHPAVWSACVVRSLKDKADGWVLHVVPAAQTGVPADTLKAFLTDRVPAYMVPVSVALHARMPLTPAGRLDYQVLRDPRWITIAAPAQSGIPGNAEPDDAKDEIESKLAALFAELLHVPQVDVRRSFFDLGGHSLLGVKLFARIEKEFHQRLPLATLLAASSVRALAQRLRDGLSGANHWSCLVPIQTEGSGPLFFCVHGAGGNVLLYRELARRMAPKVRFYGLQAQGLDGRSPSQTRIEDMAQVYLREILALQPHGPYFLGGYCMGGNIAYEIGQLLLRQGKTVGLVAMLDTYNLRKSNYSRSALDRFRIWLQKGGFHLNTLVHLSMAERKVYLAEKLRLTVELIQGKSQALFRNRKPYNEAEDAGGRIITFVQNANHIALTGHQPQPFAGDVVLFRPRKNYFTFRDPQMGWGDLVTGRLESVVVTANPHAMLIEPFVQRLAEELNQRIVEAPRPDPTPTIN